jgi:hypothetical protein
LKDFLIKSPRILLPNFHYFFPVYSYFYGNLTIAPVRHLINPHTSRITGSSLSNFQRNLSAATRKIFTHLIIGSTKNFLYSNPKSVSITDSQALPGNQCHSCSASPATIEAEPPDMRYQEEPGNE